MFASTRKKIAMILTVVAFFPLILGLLGMLRVYMYPMPDPEFHQEQLVAIIVFCVISIIIFLIAWFITPPKGTPIDD